MSEHYFRGQNVMGCNTGSETPRFVGIRFVETFSGYSKASIMRRIAQGRFPKPAFREGTVVRWDYGSLMTWRESKLSPHAPEEQVAA